MSAQQVLARAHGFAIALRRPGVGRSAIGAAVFNVVATAAAGLGGIIVARTLGPAIRGEYAAIVAWFSLALLVGGVGQPAALCYYAAREPGRAHEYVATSRTMMILTGVLAMVMGLLLAPVLAHANPAMTTGYRIAFGATIVTFVGTSYVASLQARDLHQWNKVRVSQAIFAFVTLAVLRLFDALTLYTALETLVLTTFLQCVWAYFSCRNIGLAPGRFRTGLMRPLMSYGAAQVAAEAPGTVNFRLDQLVLSQIVPLAALGQYAVAVSLTTLPCSLVSAIGYVLFPRLAAEEVMSKQTQRLQRRAVASSVAAAFALVVPLAASAYWLIPLIYGPAYRHAVVLLWLLTPGSIALCCGQVFGNLLNGRKRPQLVASAEGLAAVFTVILLFTLVPLIGVSGAAVASTVAYTTSFVTMLWFLWLLPRDPRWRPKHRVRRL